MGLTEKTGNPLVSVVIPAYNAGPFIEETVGSVLDQTYTDIEVIVCDDGSTDDTVEKIRAMMEKDSRVRLVTQDRGGVSRARNLAIGSARGDFIALLDHDDVWSATKLEKQMPLFNDEKVGLAYCDAFHWLNGRKDTDRVFARVKPFRGRVFGQLLENFFILCQSAVIRRRLLDGMEYVFDPAMEMCEEYDLFLRLALVTDFDYVDEPLVRWRIHGSNDTFLRPELKIVDMNRIIGKLLHSNADLAGEYGRQVESFRKSIRYYQAGLYWKDGRKMKAFAGFFSLAGYRIQSIVLALLSLCISYDTYVSLRYGRK
ncbi:MAG: UDP-Glc:alpha-D-GlcNAc-diphosphoundecaprenol beta-1,3-glucosyltransferase WfgD [Syntrophorhabdus sp. PtaB.Bin047]|jgi:glycosyltransferase involved in cell wall biosynthesis|nr:MAG: UDP-Glc:alpha-D-GlcNAc-diphosphoundecaprenol beta-1,3-glucosyltransferase WfgD [Syntrophorhabdus sp. PtaB.Bin047]